MKYNPIVLITLLLSFTLLGCKKNEQETLTPKITNDKVETTATTATFKWTVDWPGKLISVVEVSENEDMSHSQTYGSDTETDNHNFSVTVTDLKMVTKYYYRYLVWNRYYVNNKFVLEKKGFCVGCVDLGLPSGTLWATCNVGANSPEEYGDYFAWGEIQPKNNYNWSTYQYSNDGSWPNFNLTKYCDNPSLGYNGFTDNLTTLRPSDDAATANCGSGVRIPTKEEWQEVRDYCTRTWTTLNSVEGWKFTASNGESLFLPAAGHHTETGFSSAGFYGAYWSSSLRAGAPCDAGDLNFDSDYCGVNDGKRNLGQSVRAVRSAS